MITRIGKYEVQAELGHDAFVRAFRAFDPDAARPVTVLVLTEVADRERLTSFRSDAAAAANIHHRGIAAIYELGEHVGLPFLAIQDPPGDDLRQVIARRPPLTLLQKMSLMSEVAEGLKAAHRGGINHLGIRPAGVVLLEDGSAKITEFGAVRPGRPAQDGSSHDDDVLYLSPEQLRSSIPPDSLSDIFVYGVIYYELLTGEHPFAGADPREVRRKIGEEEPLALRALAPGCPEALEQIVYRALRKDRELRYQTLDDVQCDAEPVLQELKREQAAALVVECRALLSGEELERAQAVVREIVELDPGNTEARPLRDAIRDRLQRGLIRSRLDALLLQAGREVAARRFDEAVGTLECGLRLDSSNVALQSRLQEARVLLDRSQRASELLTEARRLLDRHHLHEARRSVSVALENDPDNPEARRLLERIQEAIQLRAEETRFEDDLAQAKNLLLLESFEEAIAILTELEAARPGSPQVDHWLTHARKQKSAKERQDRLQAGLNETRRQLENLQFQEAIQQLEILTAEFPDEDGVLDLWAAAQDRLETHERTQAVEKVRSEAQWLREAGDFSGAIRALEQGLKSFPQEAKLKGALEEALGALASHERAQTIAGIRQEAQWLTDQGRPDLAVQLLRESSIVYPEETGLASQLALTERTLADWETRRSIQEALARVAALEQKQQWTTALTVVQEALTTYPDSAELAEAGQRLQDRIRENERRRKLSRRVELIRQKMAEQAWLYALSLIEAAQRDFPDEPELEQLLLEFREQQRRAEQESAVTTIEQCLADGDVEQAEQIVRSSLGSYPGDTRLDSLQEEVHREKTYQDQWRVAEVLFGRRQFREAEDILLALAVQKPDNTNVHRLLETVRSEHAATEERQFCDRGRAKAQQLMEEGHFEEAVDLLRNLLSLFPSPILDRDLQSALAARDRNRAAPKDPALQEAAVVTPVVKEIAPAVMPIPPRPAAMLEPLYPPTTRFDLAIPPWRRPALLTILLSVLVASAAVPLWISSRKQQSAALASTERRSATPDTGEATLGDPKPSPVPSGAIPSPGAARKPTAGKAGKSTGAAPAQRLLQALNVSRPGTPRGARSPVAAPPPEGIDASALGIPSGLPGPVLQFPAAEIAPAAPVVSDPGPASARVGGEFQEPQLLSGPTVVVPPLARERKIYGVVKLEATISREGKVTNVVVLSGQPVLVEVAKQAILARRYRPATLNGDPIEIKIPIQVVFDPGR